MSSSTPGARIHWEWGSGYDLFASLFVIHQKENVGIPKSWSAGVRNRLTAESRDVLARIVPTVGIPFHWLSRGSGE
ncbi:MAG: hypothetical protein E4H09_04140, partial [Spirochaetales bacterium]